MIKRILYLPIIEPGAFHETALLNKRGLLDALSERYEVMQVDYLAEHARGELLPLLGTLIQSWSPDMLLTQFHGANIVSPDELRDLRTLRPNMLVVNWSGDSWVHSLTAPPMVDLCRQIDVQLVAAPDVLPEYERLGIPAAYWQIAYEYPVGPLPDVPAYDVVFLGNVISDIRRQLIEMLHGLRDEGITVGIYGDWVGSDGNCLYDFAFGEALYKKAKLTVADAAYPEQENYISNRPFQALVAGGALLLHQHIPKMFEMTGLEHGLAYDEWTDLTGLKDLIFYWLSDDPVIQRTKHIIVAEGQAEALSCHTYQTRVSELFGIILPAKGIIP